VLLINFSTDRLFAKTQELAVVNSFGYSEPAEREETGS
jgi:hypothetical protein